MSAADKQQQRAKRQRRRMAKIIRAFAETAAAASRCAESMQDAQRELVHATARIRASWPKQTTGAER